MPQVEQPSDDAVANAAAHLRAGGLVAFPTETVYGLGAATVDGRAVARIYAIKGRPADNPLIAHVADVNSARTLTTRWDDRAERLAARFWPGPLTLVVPKSPIVPELSTGGRQGLAIRSPAHPVAQRLLRAFGGPVSAPSANRSGRVSPTTAQHVAEEFADARDLMILDGGPCAVGIESTVLDLGAADGDGVAARLLRPGSVTMEEIEAVIGPIERGTPRGQDASPGTRTSHYAPSTPAMLASREQLAEILARTTVRCAVLCAPDVPVHPPHTAIVMPTEAGRYATRLYAALREADAADADRIVIQLPPADAGGLWCAIIDRLRRACAG